MTEVRVGVRQFPESGDKPGYGTTESAEDSAFLDDQLEAEARVFACSDLLGAPHGGHGFAREVR